MKILQLTKKVPYPLKDGESIAITQLAKGLSSLGCEIDLLSFNSIKHHVDFNMAKKEMSHYKIMEDVFLDNRVKPIPAFINLFTNKSYNIDRFNKNEYKNKLILLLENQSYDIILIESLFMCLYIDVIKTYSNAKVVMRSHNIEYQIWERLSKNENSRIKRWYLSLLTKRLERFEIFNMVKYDLLIPISSKDEKYYKSINKDINILTIPTGVDMDSYSDCKKAIHDPVRFFFIGSLDWTPNIEGLKWFLKEVWKKKSFNAELYIAGRNCPKWLIDYSEKDVIVKGEVENAHNFICKNDIMIVPLFSGSGIRIKIIESMAIGKPVISTAVGMEGICAVDNSHIFKADSAKEFLNTMEAITTMKLDVDRVSTDAQEFIFKEFNQLCLSKLLFKKISNLILV